MHWRYATHGQKIDALCHPFPICESKLALFHNGIIHCEAPPATAKKQSDTSQFASKYRKSPPALILSQQWLEDAAAYVGPFNKLVILASDGQARIVNANAGQWKDGRWHSNGSLITAGERFVWHTRPMLAYRTLADYANDALQPKPAAVKRYFEYNTQEEYEADRANRERYFIGP